MPKHQEMLIRTLHRLNLPYVHLCVISRRCHRETSDLPPKIDWYYKGTHKVLFFKKLIENTEPVGIHLTTGHHRYMAWVRDFKDAVQKVEEPAA